MGISLYPSHLNTPKRFPQSLLMLLLMYLTNLRASPPSHRTMIILFYAATSKNRYYLDIVVAPLTFRRPCRHPSHLHLRSPRCSFT
ncbi:hypothetical protein BGZ61DRAFT_115864 [Ilyonectria robusta]|uniref:uncharacterized protein n=1 Tax=Ilyonectria robusta TaxID=1079257 RepID=UPI001E8EAD6D|nr:uncharacterized protein BGZ61DRAFT_115864 [Ilyonectria robusta]KAH8669270.1 hypothetical protein BGZ61DRAFT_115864 [Ilyonectria robusta]